MSGLYLLDRVIAASKPNDARMWRFVMATMADSEADARQDAYNSLCLNRDSNMAKEGKVTFSPSKLNDQTMWADHTRDNWPTEQVELGTAPGTVEELKFKEVQGADMARPRYLLVKQSEYFDVGEEWSNHVEETIDRPSVEHKEPMIYTGSVRYHHDWDVNNIIVVVVATSKANAIAKIKKDSDLHPGYMDPWLDRLTASLYPHPSGIFSAAFDCS